MTPDRTLLPQRRQPPHSCRRLYGRPHTFTQDSPAAAALPIPTPKTDRRLCGGGPWEPRARASHQLQSRSFRQGLIARTEMHQARSAGAAPPRSQSTPSPACPGPAPGSAPVPVARAHLGGRPVDPAFAVGVDVHHWKVTD